MVKYKQWIIKFTHIWDIFPNNNFPSVKSPEGSLEKCDCFKFWQILFHNKANGERPLGPVATFYFAKTGRWPLTAADSTNITLSMGAAQAKRRVTGIH